MVLDAATPIGWGAAAAAHEAGARLVLPAKDARELALLKSLYSGEDTVCVLWHPRQEHTVALSQARLLGHFERLDHVVAPLGAWWQPGEAPRSDHDAMRAQFHDCVAVQFALTETVKAALRESRGSYTLITDVGGVYLGRTPLSQRDAAPSLSLGETQRALTEATSLELRLEVLAGAIELDTERFGAALSDASVAGLHGLSKVLRDNAGGLGYRINELRLGQHLPNGSRQTVSGLRMGDTLLSLMQDTLNGEVLRYSPAVMR